MGYIGLLQTPNSPIINSKNPKDYIKPSYFPIPYEVVQIVESFNVKSIHSWDINVSKQNVVFKLHVDKAKSDSKDDELFPKTVLNSISTYNIENPTWNSSYNNNKLSLKIDWKLKSNNMDISPPIVQNTINSSYVSTPMMKTPQHKSYVHDSGYKSFNTSPYNNPSAFGSSRNNYVNKPSNYSFSPRQRVDLFDSKNHRQDIYRPTPDNISPLKVSSNSPVKRINSKNINSSDMDSNRSDLVNDQQQSNRMLSDDKLSHVNSVPVHEYSKETIPTKSHVHESEMVPEMPNDKSSTNVTPPVSLKDNSVTLHDIQSSKSLIPNVNPSTEKVIPSDMKQVSDSDDELYSDPDYNTNANFCPLKNSFAKQPKKIKISNGILSDNIDAEYMNLDGVCRLFNKHVPSYLAGRHVFECPRSDMSAVTDFCVQQAKKLKSKCKDILNVILEIQSFKLQDDKFPKTIFKNIKSYHKFAILVDKLEQSQTDTFFKECGIPTSRVVDILSYEHLC